MNQDVKKQEEKISQMKTDPLRDPSPKIPTMNGEAKNRKKVYYDILAHRKSNYRHYR